MPSRALTTQSNPLFIRMHESDNVAIVANDDGLPAGATFPNGLQLREEVPQGHNVALVDLPAGAPVVRYNVAIGYALKDVACGSWVHERQLQMPDACALTNLPIATFKAERSRLHNDLVLFNPAPVT